MLPPDFEDVTWEVWPGVLLHWAGTPTAVLMSYELTETKAAFFPYQLKGERGGRGLVWGLELVFGEA